MTKMILLAGTMAFAAPAFAQVATPAQTTAPAAPQTTPAPATTAASPQAAPVAQAAQPATPAAAAPAATPSQSQVAQVVDQQFGTYDKDADGTLSKTEFAAWMDALKAQANAKDASPAAAMAWNDAAFKQADGDKSATVSKTELTGFLVRGASGQS